MDGASLAARMKAEAGLKDVVFLLLTPVSQWKDHKALEVANVDACLVKPLRHARLKHALAEAWSKSGENSPMPAPVRVLPAASARALVVEDNAINQKVALSLLAKLGVRADVAGNGREGLEMLRMLPYDIVFMDCQMPDMNGYEASAQLRLGEGPNQRVPIVALTGEVLGRERCLEAGMNDVITKPITLEGLSGVLRSLVGQDDILPPIANRPY
jgi:two-component system, sensor histidine kinase and response regulator